MRNQRHVLVVFWEIAHETRGGKVVS
ncbi:hypothetical protein EMIT0P100_40173 [Pseudomonas sp. IT-P100]